MDQNEADTHNLAPGSQPQVSRRPSAAHAHHRRDSHHHGGESHPSHPSHSSKPQPHLLSALGPGFSQAPAPSQHSQHREHHGERTHHSREHGSQNRADASSHRRDSQVVHRQHLGENLSHLSSGGILHPSLPSHHERSHQGDDSHPGAPPQAGGTPSPRPRKSMHPGATPSLSSEGSYLRGISRSHGERRPPGEGSQDRDPDHPDRERRHREHHHHRRREHPGSPSQASYPHKSHSILRTSPSPIAGHLRKGLGQSLTQSHVTFYSTPSRHSSRVHPHTYRDSESWSEEHVHKHKSRLPRGHKKPHSVDIFQSLKEKVSLVIWGFRKLIWQLTESLAFETFIFIVVCLNTIMLIAQTFAEVEVRGEYYFLLLDCIFLCVYVVEAMLKLIALGLSYFYDLWNNLDFFIMLMAVLDFALMQINSLSFSFYSQSLYRLLRVFKSMRALRAIRVLRRLSILTSLQEVTGTLSGSLPSIVAILTLMFTCLFLFSVVLRALFRKSDPKRFQNIFTTIFTLFTLLTLDDWSLIYLDSRAEGAWYIIPILMVYIIIQYFIFLNLVIAVLVDNFQMALLKGLEKVKQEKAAMKTEKLLDDSLTELQKTDPDDNLSEEIMWKDFIERKFGNLTESQKQLQFQFLQLVAAVEQQQQQFRSQASVIDEIVDTTFEAGEEDFK